LSRQGDGGLEVSKKALRRCAMAKRLSRDPVALTWRQVHPTLGKGRVSLFDARAGLPQLLAEFPPELLKSMPWVVVHFPSRRAVLLKSKKLGLDYLKEVKDGEDKLGLTQSPVESVKKPSARARATKVDPKKEAVEPQKPDPEETKAGDSKPKNEDGTTFVPEGMTFDQAMQHVFSPARITGEFERLLAAKRTIYTKDGDEVGDEIEWMARIQTLTRIVSYHQGRPPEKEKPPKEKAKMSLEELESLVMTSPAARKFMSNLLKKAEAVADVTNPAPPAARVKK
jgi:hypothetical protein